MRTTLTITIGLATAGISSAQFTPFCNAVVNSTGSPATIAAVGSPDVAANALALECSSLPSESFGTFLVSDLAPGGETTPGGSIGNLCLTSGFGFFRSSVQFTGTASQVSLPLDLNALPLGASGTAAAPGDTYHFQYWFRDASAGMGTSNFSDGVSVQFDAPAAGFTFDANTVGLRYTTFQDTSEGTPMSVDWDFDFTGTAANASATFVAQVPGSAGGTVEHDFERTGPVQVALRAIYANGSQVYDIQTVNVDAITYAEVVAVLAVGDGTISGSGCAGCHAATGTSAGFAFGGVRFEPTVASYDLLKDVPVGNTFSCGFVAGRMRVEPYNRMNSMVFLVADPTLNPCASMAPLASAAGTQLVGDWIDQGAAFD